MDKYICCLVKLIYKNEEAYYLVNENMDVKVGDNVIVPILGKKDSFDEGQVADIKIYDISKGDEVPREVKALPRIFEVIDESVYDEIINDTLTSRKRVDSLDFYDIDDPNNFRNRFEDINPSDVPHLIDLFLDIHLNNDLEYLDEIKSIKKSLEALKGNINQKTLKEIYDKTIKFFSYNDYKANDLKIRAAFILKVLWYFGYQDAGLFIGNLYFKGDYLPQSYESFYKYNYKLSKIGNVQAIKNCGDCYLYGFFLKKDLQKAYNCFSSSAALCNDSESLYKMGDIYLDKAFDDFNEVLGFKLYEKAYLNVDKDIVDVSPYVETRLGKCYLYGIGVQKDLDKAREYLKNAQCGCAFLLGQHRNAQQEWNLNKKYFKELSEIYPN